MGKLKIKQVILYVLITVIHIGSGFNVCSFAQSSINLKDSNYRKRLPVTSPTPGEFPIVASTVCNSVIGPKKSDLEGIKECGFNLCRHSANAQQFEKLLGCMEGTGLKLLMHNSSFEYNGGNGHKINNWEKDIISFVNRFKDNPLVAGWQLKDEPKWNDLLELRKRYTLLKNVDSSHFILINLVGVISKPFTGPCKTLDVYLDSIQSIFDLYVWSSDYYPIMKKNGKLTVNYQDFFNDLEVFSAKSKVTGIPMWSYCESMEYSTEHYSRPAATIPYLSFEIFSALAYGAQGIVYWTYWQRPSTSRETYISALVDLDGNRTKAWYAAKEINFQIKALTPVFLGAEMIECRHTGLIKMKNAMPYIEKFGPIENLTNEEGGVLVSWLKNGEKNYIIIVNHNVENKQNINVKFIPTSRITKLTVSSSGTLKRKKVRRKYSDTLTPGGYIILEWN